MFQLQLSLCHAKEIIPPSLQYSPGNIFNMKLKVLLFPNEELQASTDLKNLKEEMGIWF